jgi:hypothetical protein
MPLVTSVSRLLASPGPEALWDVRGDVMALSDRLPPSERARADWSLAIATRFHQYLGDLASKTTAHQYSQWASQLDLGSVGMLALQDLVTDRERLLRKLLLGGLGEGLMLAASRQYVKAWQAEASQVHEETLWWLFEALWRLSRDLRPELPPERRRDEIERLLAAARSGDSEPEARAALLVALFQALLLASLDWALPLLPR